jgi:hypothetical protein
VSRLQKNRFKAGPDQTGVQPLRQRTRFEPDARNRQTKPFKESDERFRLARDLAFLHDLAASVDNAHARQFQRHVNSGMLFHTCPPFAMSGRINRTLFPILSGDSYLTAHSEQGPLRHLTQLI